ncbi:DeoR/GlpR family DNA-binding transcription regulator [Roseospira visakhapatnamensis]|uniref:DeoR family glycerol-3-phosphate regulon repressor n=1 Tax=Roseospira visakhapatnamensis TaxID=390880 RepID=A0A7W6RD72_9PROT|nr:DeoR/GlpR family DNA-binding transcription regulator [Roseospira visakhapatnamensis]MBB4266127.1 DeoR family glycerol-3-phosphate regulon repressor [Roseospira visakhapatnamensis]
MSTALSRKRLILDLAREQGRVAVDDLAARLAVSPQTIRKDLNDLCDTNHLVRTHGGALLRTGKANVGYEARRLIAADAKDRIAERTAGLIPDDSSLFVNIGTTTEAVARALAGRSDLLVITNNLNVATILREARGLDVVIVGGLLRHSDGGIVGEAALDMIGQFKVDIAIIGTSAIDEDGTLLDYDYREVRITQAILANARRRILVADSSKIARRAPVRIAHLSQLDVFVTDTLPDPEIRRLCREAGTEIHETCGRGEETSHAA